LIFLNLNLNLKPDKAWHGMADHPNQEILQQSIQTHHSLDDPASYSSYRKTLRHHNRDLGLETTFTQNDIEVLITPPTGRVATVAATAGYPFGTLPLGYARSNGRPFGMIAIVRPDREDLIVRVMSAWEAIMSRRVPPSVSGGRGCEVVVGDLVS
jgi:amidase